MRCTLCPRLCGAERTETAGSGFCRMPAGPVVAQAGLHMWEEPCISGTRGSGTVFFSGCTLGCVFCQNHEISAQGVGKPVSVDRLREIFRELIRQGAHNINLVTPTHFVPRIRQALLVKKLPVPVVYNTSGYERVETLRSLEGLVDIYLPDYKYDDPALAKALSRAEDYPQRAQAALAEMVRQVGAPVYDGEGLMTRGVLIRHLILPGHTKNSIACLERIRQLFPGIPVSLMAQYTPCGELDSFPELGRPITRREQEKVENALFELGLEGYTQSRKAKGAQYVPDWDMG